MAAWEKLFKPWLRALNTVGLEHIMDMPHIANGPRECWWGIETQLPPPNEFSGELWTLVREAMELLDLVARVEPQAVRRLLTWVTGVSDPLAAKQRPRFQIRVDDEWDMLPPASQQGVLLLLTHDQRAPSETYESVKASLMASWTSSHDGRVLDRDVDGHVELVLGFTISVDEGRGPMEALRTLTRAHVRNVSPSSAEASRQKQQNPIALHSLHVRLIQVDQTPVTDYMLQQFNEIATTGVSIANFSFVSLLHAQLNPANLGKFMLSQFLAPPGNAGVRDLEISACKFDVAAVQAFCTAIAHSTSLHQIDFEIADFFGDEVDGMEPQTNEWWRWLAFALFSGHTSHAIYTVSVNSESLTMNHVHSIREVLLHHNPLALLYRDLATEWSQCLATLHESATVYPGHHHAVAPSHDRHGIQLHGSVAACQVVRDRADEDFVEVILPGTGVGWLSRSDIVEMKPLVKRNAHPVRQLHITGGRFGGPAAQPVIEFLQLMGAPLEHLHLSHGEGLIDTNFSSSIFASCPNLAHLRVQQTQLESLDWLAEAPATCKLTKLELSLGSKLAQGNASWSRLFAALSDHSHPLTRSLRHLQINFRRREQDAEDAAEEDAVCRGYLAMLRKNRLLQHCVVVLCGEQADTKYTGRFNTHNGETLWEPLHPVPLAQKLAFLSAISPAQEPQSQQKQPKTAPDSAAAVAAAERAWTKLTTEIIGLVFAFAAEPKRRECRVTRA